MVTFYQVDLREDGATFQVSIEVLDVGNRVAVGGGGSVEAAEVAAWTPRPVALPDHV